MIQCLADSTGREAVNVHNNPLAIDHGTESSSPASSKKKK